MRSWLLQWTGLWPAKISSAFKWTCRITGCPATLDSDPSCVLRQVPRRQWNAGSSSAQTSKRPPRQHSGATTLATTSGRFNLFQTPINACDSFKWKRGVDNKRHTNTHPPLTDCSTTEVSIPPLSARLQLVPSRPERPDNKSVRIT